MKADASGGADAIALLEADHRLLHRLFADYADLARAHAPRARRRELAERICTELTIHTRLEEELFYPAAREALHEPDLLDESEQQHESTKDLVAQILAMGAKDELYDARVAVLRDYVERHVQQERNQVFTRLQEAAVDLRALGRRIAVRRQELAAVTEALREDALASAML